MWAYADLRAAIRDALRLSEGMTWKSAVAGLPLGGGKGVIVLPPDRPVDAARREAALEDFGEAIEALGGSYVTAEDVGTSTADMDVIARRTSQVAGRDAAHGGSGDPSPFTALGVEASIEAALEQHTGSPELRGRSVTVVGLGHVGSALARSLAARGATLTVTDIDPRRRADAEALGARWVPAEQAIGAATDVWCPCALGGVLDHETAALLQAPVVVGAANNQLADPSVAGALRDRGVLWAPDFVANAGGIINIACERGPGGYDAATATRAVRGIGATMRAVLADASARDVTPLEAAMERARRRVADAATSPAPSPAAF